MKKNKGIYIDRNTIADQIRIICADNWNEYNVSDIYAVGNAYRCDIIVETKKALLNFYFRNDGTTTVQAAGSNIEISQLIKTKLESDAKYTGKIEAKTCSFKKLPPEWMDKLIGYFKDSSNVNVKTTEILKHPKHIEYLLTSSYGDKLTINQYTSGTIVLQGKPAYIYGEAIAFLSYCNDITVNDIIESISSINKVTVKTDDVHSELKSLLKASYDGIDPVILKILSPAIALRKINIGLEDYSCFAFPALRALEGYIKWLLLRKEIVVNNTFYGIFADGKLIPDIDDENYKNELERLYIYFKDNRHVHFHAEQILIGTELIEKRSEADDIINTVIELIESSYKNVII